MTGVSLIELSPPEQPLARLSIWPKKLSNFLRAVSELTGILPCMRPLGLSRYCYYLGCKVFCVSAKNIDDALTYETEQSAKVVTTEAIVGAKKFAAGLGKHGKFNVNQIAEKEVGFLSSEII